MFNKITIETHITTPSKTALSKRFFIELIIFLIVTIAAVRCLQK